MRPFAISAGMRQTARLFVPAVVVWRAIILPPAASTNVRLVIINFGGITHLSYSVRKSKLHFPIFSENKNVILILGESDAILGLCGKTLDVLYQMKFPNLSDIDVNNGAGLVSVLCAGGYCCVFDINDGSVVCSYIFVRKLTRYYVDVVATSPNGVVGAVASRGHVEVFHVPSGTQVSGFVLHHQKYNLYLK